MDRRNNILSHLIKNENEITELIYALLVYKPFRNTLLRFLTNKGEAETADISWDDIYIQTKLGGGIPDLSIIGRSTNILVEIKITPWRGLTDNQPQVYLQWLASQEPSKTGYFVAIIPSGYYHIEELKQRIKSFNVSNISNPIVSRIVSRIVTWGDVLNTLQENDLDQMNPYIRDLCDLLSSWYEIPIIKFTLDEVNKMYDVHTAKAIRKLIKLVEDVVDGLKQDYQIQYSFNKKWWESEYGAYVKHGDQYLLWFGIWQDYWEKTGEPLCFGVKDGWDVNICAEFKRIHPDKYTKFPPDVSKPFLTVGIQKYIFLSENPALQIIDILKEDLQRLCKQLEGAEKAERK